MTAISKITAADFVRVPNLVSLLRVALTPVMVYLLWKGDNTSALICLALMIVAGISDGLDGYLARRLNQVTQLGLVLDPVADKIMVAGLVIALIWFRDFPLWLALIIVGRDLLILLTGLLLLKGQRLLVPSNLSGKYAFAAITVLISCYVIRFPFGMQMTTYAVVILTALSMVQYTRVFALVKSGRQPRVFADRPLYRTLRIITTVAYAIPFLFYLYFYLPNIINR
jgi:CDP-diacylglycerol--glycerol-3-phosphate 3-phosphatidyltransferase